MDYIHKVMPAQITHLLAGERALALASPALAEGFARNRGAARWFGLGCQGPDLFYHNQRTRPSGLHYGSLAHRRDYGAIVEGAFRASREGRASSPGREAAPQRLEASFAWLLGFATHAAVDRALHPYIVHFSGWYDPRLPGSLAYRACHPFIERLLDLAILEKTMALPGRCFDLEAFLPLDEPGAGEADSTEAEVSALLAAGLAHAYPKAAAADFLLARRIANAFSDARYFYRATNPARTGVAGAEGLEHFDDQAGPRSLAVVYPLAWPPAFDVTNEAGRTWAHPAGDGRVSEASAFDLFEEGAREASRAIGLLLEEAACPRLEEGAMARAIGLGGLSVTDQAGRAVRPLVAEPLPLASLLETEFALRLEQARPRKG